MKTFKEWLEDRKFFITDVLFELCTLVAVLAMCVVVFWFVMEML